MKSLPLLIIILLIISLEINAEITTDGSLGSRANLPGPDYLIGADLGSQLGGNLFHSFKDFNLNSWESATFSGSNSVNNIISRVTGGNPSNINGLIRSTIPNADMYFLNPYGIMFGPNARLNIQGSFHASTADYLRLGEGGRFDARKPSDSLLTIAPIEAFGFLTDMPAPITTQDSSLSVSKGKTLSLIGGDIDLKGYSPVIFDEQGFMAVFAPSSLSADAGRINLASVASEGKVIPREFGIDLNAEGGKITVNNTLIDVSGRGSGNIFIRGGQLLMQDATIQANTLGDIDGKNIALKLTESINISGDKQAILSKTFANGDAGEIIITTPYLKMTGSSILTSSLGEGNGGDFTLDTTRLDIREGGLIACSALGNGRCGDFKLNAKASISLSGEKKGFDIRDNVEIAPNYPTHISTTAYSGDGGNLSITTDHLNLAGGLITTASLGKGNSGDIILYANTFDMNKGGFLATTGVVTGQPGNIDVIVKETFEMSGKRDDPFVIPAIDIEFKNLQSFISASFIGTNPSSQGNISISAETLIVNDESFISAGMVSDVSESGSVIAGGNIVIEVENLYLTQGGQINNSNGMFIGDTLSIGNNHGGTIQIVADNMTISGIDERGLPSGIFNDTLSSGQGGNIEIKVKHLNLTHSGTISARSHSTGNAGEIVIQANNINLTEDSNISTSAENATGGNITVNTPNLLYLQNGQITTSVSIGKGDGGNIIIDNPIFVVLDKGKIRANADAGHGGNIRIVAEQFIKSPESFISASSRLGLDGKVNIESPTVDMNAFMVVLPGGFVEAQLRQCTTEEIENPNTFKVNLIRDRKRLPFGKFLKLK
jgi:filamentous hemagglutinin family protein